MRLSLGASSGVFICAWQIDGSMDTSFGTKGVSFPDFNP